MSKKSIILFIILGYSFKSIYAQSTGGIIPFNTKEKVVIDTVKLMVSYELSFFPDSTKKNVILTNRLTLSLGSIYTKLMNSQYYDIDNLQRKAPKGTAYGVEGKGLAATIIYKNKKTNQMEVNVKLADHNTYRYIESIPKQVWKILNQKKTNTQLFLSGCYHHLSGQNLHSLVCASYPDTRRPLEIFRTSGVNS
ncbi:hypothetical protein [Bacteroides pyogenes]|uniref:hypothetical protein n=1 Tax=Bacteroides pyogenes TaxID=310300 RepID=UPI003FA01D33